MTKQQPVARVAAIVAAVKSVLGALVVFKVVHLTGEQVATAAITLETVLGVPAVLFVRSRVTPVPKPLDPRVVAAIRSEIATFAADYRAANPLP